MFATILLILIGLLFVGIGIASQNERFIRWAISWNNSMRGIATAITPQTIKMQRIGGIIVIIFGFGLIIFVLAAVIINVLMPS